MSRSLMTLLLVSGLSLTGCSLPQKDDAESEARVLKGAAKGPRITRDGYAFRAPKGWGKITRKIDGVDPKNFLFDLDDRDGFVDNLNVIEAPLDDVPLDRMESAVLNELGKSGASQRRVRERVLVAGGATVHISALMHSSQGNYYIERYSPKVDDQVYVVTFAFSPDLGRTKRERTAESVLATWTWAT